MEIWRFPLDDDDDDDDGDDGDGDDDGDDDDDDDDGDYDDRQHQLYQAPSPGRVQCNSIVKKDGWLFGCGAGADPRMTSANSAKN